MTDLQRAIATIRECEGQLRQILAEVVAEGRYTDLAAVAGLAESVRGLHAGHEAGETVESRHPASTTAAASPKPVRSGAKAKGEYPKFVRDGDKLVKIGWSKKDRREYEHRAPQEAVLHVASALARAGRTGAAFSMERILPCSLPNGQEIPSYQVYLAVAWLRHVGLVEHTGRNEYRVSSTFEMQRVNEAWLAA